MTERRNGLGNTMDRELETGERLKILVLDEWLPFPADSGKRTRTWNLLRRLACRHDVTLLCYGEPHGEAFEAISSVGICVETVSPLEDDRGIRFYGRLFLNLFSSDPYSVTKHHTRRYRNRLRHLLLEKTFELIHCEWSPYARFLTNQRGLPSVIMAHNIESQIWYRRAMHTHVSVERTFLRLQAKKMESFERAAVRRANVVAAVTCHDAQRISSWGAPRVWLVENGVDTKYFIPSRESDESKELLFLGALDWFANQDAVEYLVDEILPLLRQHSAQAKLRIVGRKPSEAMRRRLAGVNAVELVGDVPDVRPSLARAAVVVVPVRIGGGSRIKILEALAMGKAVVSTSVGAEGLALADGVHLLLADTPDLFAKRVAELLASRERRCVLGEAGRKMVEERYDWDRIALCLESAWRCASDDRERVEVQAPTEEVLIRP